MEEFKVGDIIKGRYSLIRFLGNGSFGEVWLAHYCSLGAHGGTIEAVLGAPDYVNEYANNCM